MILNVQLTQLTTLILKRQFRRNRIVRFIVVDKNMHRVRQLDACKRMSIPFSLPTMMEENTALDPLLKKPLLVRKLRYPLDGKKYACRPR